MKCLDCPTGVAFSRGLCRPCYHRHNKDGTLVDFPRSKRPREDVIEDWLFLRSQGYSRQLAAERMGMTRMALDRAIARAKNDGEERLILWELMSA